MNANLTAFLQSAGAILSAGVADGLAAYNIVTLLTKVLESEDPTADDWDVLHAYESKQTAVLDAPMQGEKPVG